MSEMYEGVVFRSDERTARRVFAALPSDLHLRLVRLARGVFGVYRVTGRGVPFDQHGTEGIARRISKDTGQAIALFYDNSCGIKVGVRYSVGKRGREFGDGDAWWVPYGDDGELDEDGPKFRVTELQRDIEYDCIFSAIDAALEAVGISRAGFAEVLKEAFCYEEFATLAENR
jgi:hypothetical protein